jgi:outer membrane protein
MRRLTVPVFLCVLLATLPATAGKIGFVNAELAISQVDEGQAEFDKLRRWQDPEQAKLDRLRDRVMALRDQLAKAQGSATPEELSSIERNELEARRAFEDARRDYERNLEAKKNEFLSGIASKLGAVGTEYAKANDFDAVFLLTAQPMVYVSDTADITEEVVKAYNQRYPVNGQ